MGTSIQINGRNNQETIGIIMPTIHNPFAYAMKNRHLAKLKEQKKYLSGLKRASANLNKRTSATGLFGADKSPFNTNVVKSVNAIKNRRGLEDILVKRFDMTIRDMTDKELLQFAKEHVEL
jgi:hypothetical protein|tara:strand:- start:106 stop:468 length:363 start_codon:yes stop_codon:yes gene_type:complete